MKEGQIYKEAKARCTTEAQAEWLKDYCTSCFVEGAQWRINSVWHDANERPNGMFVILIDFGTEISPEEFGIGLTADDLDGAKRWAYISDLFPERKE